MKTAKELRDHWTGGLGLSIEAVLSGEWLIDFIEDVQRDALETAAGNCDLYSRQVGILRSLKATYKSEAAQELAEQIRALKPKDEVES